MHERHSFLSSSEQVKQGQLHYKTGCIIYGKEFSIKFSKFESANILKIVGEKVLSWGAGFYIGPNIKYNVVRAGMYSFKFPVICIV